MAEQRAARMLIAAVADVAAPAWRGSAIGVYRFWRDMGYVAGALAAGLLADLAGIGAAIAATGVLTVASGLLVAARMPETLRRSPAAAPAAQAA